MMLLGRPYTVENGCEDNELITDLNKEDMEVCFNWIKKNLEPRKLPNKRISSYGLKHKLQHDTNIYLTNNQFKDAMLMCGYEPVDPDVLNWFYRIANTSKALKF